MTVTQVRSSLNEIERLFDGRGRQAYGGELVSQTEHALQSALLAGADGASDELICAALLHDIGHLLHSGDESLVIAGIDAHHEAIGARWLARHFPLTVSAPVRLHVAAKRHLCATDPAYSSDLSPASQQSLVVQGGAFSEAEQRAFTAEPFAAPAIQLRRWDEAAKVVGMKLPAIKHFRAILERCMS